MSLMWYDPFRSSRWGLYPRTEDFFGKLIPREFENWWNVPSWGDMDTGAEVVMDKDKFNVNVDVQQFKPNEISVKVADNAITVEGKHEEKRDEHGYISRHFVRRYILPEGHDAGKVESRLSSDGVLTITAPKVGDPKAKEREVPIAHTGQPSRPIEDKTKNKL